MCKPVWALIVLPKTAASLYHQNGPDPHALSADTNEQGSASPLTAWCSCISPASPPNQTAAGWL